MRYVVPTALLLVALIHAMPVIGVLGADRLSRLYGVAASDTSLALLLRHRAVLFGLLAAVLAIAAFKPALQGLALVAGVASVGSFLVLAAQAGTYSPAIATVVRVDWLALAVLLATSVVHLRSQ